MKYSRISIQIICILCILNIFITHLFLDSTILCFCNDTDVIFVTTSSHCNDCDEHKQENHVESHHKHDCSDVLPFQYSYFKRSQSNDKILYKLEMRKSDTFFYSNENHYLKNYSCLNINSQIDLKADLILIC